MRVCRQNAHVTFDTGVLTAHTDTCLISTRRRFESTHAHTPTHTHTRHQQHTTPTLKNFVVENRTQMPPLPLPNDLHESLPFAHKPPTWATSPILLFQRQCLHHKRMHVMLSTHTRHTQHTHPQHTTHTQSDGKTERDGRTPTDTHMPIDRQRDK